MVEYGLPLGSTSSSQGGSSTPTTPSYQLLAHRNSAKETPLFALRAPSWGTQWLHVSAARLVSLVPPLRYRILDYLTTSALIECRKVNQAFYETSGLIIMRRSRTPKKLVGSKHPHDQKVKSIGPYRHVLETVQHLQLPRRGKRSVSQCAAGSSAQQPLLQLASSDVTAIRARKTVPKYPAVHRSWEDIYVAYAIQLAKATKTSNHRAKALDPVIRHGPSSRARKPSTDLRIRPHAYSACEELLNTPLPPVTTEFNACWDCQTPDTSFSPRMELTDETYWAEQALAAYHDLSEMPISQIRTQLDFNGNPTTYELEDFLKTRRLLLRCLALATLPQEDLHSTAALEIAAFFKNGPENRKDVDFDTPSGQRIDSEILTPVAAKGYAVWKRLRDFTEASTNATFICCHTEEWKSIIRNLQQLPIPFLRYWAERVTYAPRAIMRSSAKPARCPPPASLKTGFHEAGDVLALLFSWLFFCVVEPAPNMSLTVSQGRNENPPIREECSKPKDNNSPQHYLPPKPEAVPGNGEAVSTHQLATPEGLNGNQPSPLKESRMTPAVSRQQVEDKRGMVEKVTYGGKLNRDEAKTPSFKARRSKDPSYEYEHKTEGDKTNTDTPKLTTIEHFGPRVSISPAQGAQTPQESVQSKSVEASENQRSMSPKSAPISGLKSSDTLYEWNASTPQTRGEKEKSHYQDVEVNGPSLFAPAHDVLLEHQTTTPASPHFSLAARVSLDPQRLQSLALKRDSLAAQSTVQMESPNIGRGAEMITASGSQPAVPKKPHEAYGRRSTSYSDSTLHKLDKSAANKWPFGRRETQS